jgi:hypothetical protein
LSWLTAVLVIMLIEPADPGDAFVARVGAGARMISRPMQARNNPLLALSCRFLRTCVLLAAGGCATEIPDTGGGGAGITAEIVAAGRVRVDGQEMRTEDFLDLVRRRVADAGGREDQLPPVTLIAAEQVRNTTVPARVFEALRSTGVRLVHLEVGR